LPISIYLWIAGAAENARLGVHHPADQNQEAQMGTVRWIFAALHLLALGIGLGAIWWRARALRGTLDREGLKRLFYADNLWGAAALLWILTGLVRAFTGLEKGSDYYLNSTAFVIKMILLAIVLLLEIWPMTTFIRWRIHLARGGKVDVDHRRANLFTTISMVQAGLIVLMVFAATAMARGLGS
jgi:putative membrane protein